MDRLATVLLIVAIVLAFCVSPMALSAAGIEYGRSVGPAWQKLHPATYIGVLAFAANTLAQRRPLEHLQTLACKFPGVAYFIVMWTLLMVYGVAVQKAPLSSLLEPYVVAIVALVMFDDLRPWAREFLRRFIHVALSANALLGVFEYATHLRLIPYVISGVPVVGDMRATATLGHPLLNAATTGAYLLCLLMGGDPRLTSGKRVALVVVSIAGLVAFGGRTAIVASSLVAGVLAIRELASILLGRRFSLSHLIAALLVVPIASSVIIVGTSAGVFDALLNRFVDDNGSAGTRVVVWRLFEMFDFSAILLGPTLEQLNAALKILGLDIGIENTWLALIFQYGLLMSGFFVVGLLGLFWEFWRRTRRGGTLMFVFFIIIISSAIGLASKTMIFVQFSILLLSLFADDVDVPPTSPRRLHNAH
jgi:hypothetical protein